MKKIWIVVTMALIMSVASMASAATFNLFDNLYYADGGSSRFDPWGGNALPFDFTGLGLTTSFSSPGSHSVALMMDAEIDETINTFFNEVGFTHGTLAAGQSWQIGDPFADNTLNPNIYDLTSAGTLTNSDLNGGFANDVALALGWNFTLGANQIAYLSFSFSESQPVTGFYLEQYDPDSAASLYFSSTLLIEDTGTGGGNPVPEPSTLILLGSALAGLGLYSRRRRNA